MTFREYLTHGWRLCEIRPGAKGPTGKAADGWNKRERAIEDPARGPALPGAGLCHAWSGTCAIDVDDYKEAREWLGERGIGLDALLLAPDSVQISSGREGRAKLLYALSTPRASLKLAPYTRDKKKYHALEFRCATAAGLTVQDVLPPTIHPLTGHPYEWKYGDDLIGQWSCLPALPKALEDLWLAELAPEAPAVTVAPVGVGFPELQTLLEDHDPDEDYNTWLKIGMALHHETKGAGFALWDAWSAKGAKYKNSDDLRVHWASFRTDTKNPVTLGSLLRGVVAKPEAFPLIEPAAEPVSAPADADDSPNAVMQRIVGDHVVYVREADLYFNIKSRKLYPSNAALRNDFMPLVPFVRTGDKGGKKRLDPVNWLMTSKARRAADVESIGAHPGEGDIFTEGGVRFANGYHRPAPILPLVPKPHEWEAFDFIWGRMNDLTFANWLKKFYAHALKYPGVKIRSAPLLVSETTGTGKSLLMNLIPTLLFGRVTQMTESQLRTQFNGELLNAWWVTFEEVYAGNTKTERRFVTEKIKTWLTNDDIAINAKNLTAFTMKNRLQFTASSNHLDALQLEDVSERRWGVCHLNERAYSEKERLDAVLGFLLTPRAPGVLTHIFQQESLTGFQKDGAPPITRAKHDMVAAGLGTWESTLIEHMVAGTAPFNRDLFTLSDVRDQVFGRSLSLHALGAVLRRPPFSCELIRSEKRFWAWRNTANWRYAGTLAHVAHMETGARPLSLARPWTDALPPAILNASADCAPDETSCDDLLE